MSAVIYQRLLPAEPESVPRIRTEVAAALVFCVPEGQRRSDIALFVTEAASNVVRHAYGDAPGALYATAELEDRWLEIAISDWGHGFPTTAHEAAASRPATAGKSWGAGFGTMLMTQLADASSIDSDASGTDVVGVFELLGAAKRPGARDVRADHRRMLREYVRVLGEATDTLRQDSAAVLAEAQQAVAHSQERRRERKRLH